jgi:hypothetical protein
VGKGGESTRQPIYVYPAQLARVENGANAQHKKIVANIHFETNTYGRKRSKQTIKN